MSGYFNPMGCNTFEYTNPKYYTFEDKMNTVYYGYNKSQKKYIWVHHEYNTSEFQCLKQNDWLLIVSHKYFFFIFYH